MKLPRVGVLGGVARPAPTSQTQNLIQQGAQIRNRNIDTVFDGAIEIATGFQKSHDKFQSEEAFSTANSQMKAWEEEHGTKEYFTGDDIPDGIDVARTEFTVDSEGNEVEMMRERIPSYEVYPEMRKQQQEKINNASAKGIKSSVMRNAWLRQMGDRATDENNQISMAASSAQKDQIRASQDTEIKSALLDRDYESAMLHAQSYEGSESEVIEKVRSVKYFAESDTYNQAMSEDNAPAMRKSLEILQDADYAGNLNEVQRTAMIAQLKSSANQLTARNEASSKASNGLIGHEIDNTIKSLQDGKNVNPEEIARLSTLMDAGAANGTMEGQTWARRKYELDTLTQLQPALTEFRTVDETSRAQILRDMRADAENWQDHYRVDLFESANREADQGLKKDPLAYAERAGVVELAPLEVGETGQFTPESLKQRAFNAEASDSRYGKHVQTDLFTNQEMNMIIDSLDGQSNEEKLSFVSNINNNLDPVQANRVWSQLATNGGGGYAVLGDMLGENEVQGSKMMLAGQKVMKENPEVMKSWKSETQPALLESMGNAFGSSPQTRGMMMQGTQEVYAGLSARDHDFSGEHNQARLNEAVRLAAGNMYKVGGSTVPLPERSMSPDMFDIFLRDIDVTYMKSLGGVDGYDSIAKNGTLKNQLRNGEVQLIATAKNQYVLYDTDSGKYLRRKDNKQQFILSYDENADQRSRWERGAERIIEKVGG